MVVGQAGHRHLALDPSGWGEEVVEADAAYLREPVGAQPVQYLEGVRTLQVELGERCHVEQRDPLPHGPNLLPHRLKPAHVPEPDIVLDG